MLEIPLTQGQVTFVSDEDADLAELKWCALFNPRYADGGAFTAQRRSGSTHQRMHRVVLERILNRGLIKGEQVDHINHNTLDNRRENLRLATPQENKQNRRLQSNNSSGYKGVSFYKAYNKWIAQIHVGGKNKSLGVF